MSASKLLQKLKHQSEDLSLIINRPEEIEFGDLHFDSGIGHDGYTFVLFFARSKSDIDIEVPTVVKVTQEKAKIWVAYPKKSGKIESNITRDHGWDVLQAIGYRGVSMVSLNQNWSALRIKPADQVKSKVSARNKGKREIDTPEALKLLLASNKKAKDFYESLSFTNRKEYAHWIHDAKREKTREKRLKETERRLQEGIKNPFVK